MVPFVFADHSLRTSIGREPSAANTNEGLDSGLCLSRDHTPERGSCQTTGQPQTTPASPWRTFSGRGEREEGRAGWVRGVLGGKNVAYSR